MYEYVMGEKHVPNWLAEAVRQQGGVCLCKEEVFAAPDGSWAVWAWKDDVPPVLGLPSRNLAALVSEAIDKAYWAGVGVGLDDRRE